MSKKGMIPRDDKELLAKELLIKCHDWLRSHLNVQTELVLSRECNWGRNARHAGLYQNRGKEVRVNFRNLSGSSVYTFLKVLGHEMRHAVQYKEGLLRDSHTDKDYTIDDEMYVSGTWEGKHYDQVPYLEAPWEIDAREYQRSYAKEAIKALGITNEQLNVTTDMSIQTNSDQDSTWKEFDKKHKEDTYILLTKGWIRDKKVTKGGGICYVIKSDLPNGNLKTNQDKKWLSDRQDLIKFTPWIKVTKEYGGFSLDTLVS